MDTGPKPRRKRRRLTLGAMMIVVLGIGGVLGWIVHRAHVQRDAVAAITTLRRNTRGSVSYDWQFVDGKFDENARPRGPKWLRDALGPDVFDTVVRAGIEGDNVDDEFLENVGKLHGVEKFWIVGHAAPDLTPAGMAQLRTLSRLKTLSVRGLMDSHGFVAVLKGKTGLRRLWLPQAAVTDEEMAIIGGLRPGCPASGRQQRHRPGLRPCGESEEADHTGHAGGPHHGSRAGRRSHATRPPLPRPGQGHFRAVRPRPARRAWSRSAA